MYLSPYPFKKEKAFTLIELLVVVTIIGILASLVIAGLSRARNRAKLASKVSVIHQIELALGIYLIEGNINTHIVSGEATLIDSNGTPHSLMGELFPNGGALEGVVESFNGSNGYDEVILTQQDNVSNSLFSQSESVFNSNSSHSLTAQAFRAFDSEVKVAARPPGLGGVCTLDRFVCPDGSSVGRSGRGCLFVCSNVSSYACSDSLLEKNGLIIAFKESGGPSVPYPNYFIKKNSGYTGNGDMGGSIDSGYVNSTDPLPDVWCKTLSL